MDSNKTIEIRFYDFKNEYIDEIYKIEKESIDVAWSKDQLKELISLSNAVARVGIVDGEVVCSYSFNVILDEGDINNLSVKKSWRGNGVGNLLMEDMIKCAKDRNVDALTLEVNENNKVAINLYKEYGFSIEGIRPNFYNGKENALVMWRRNLK
ncbi:MAG: ribosomal protein S18-alanine N-acetyltransferase [Clostridia bacterium]|nr:ribosomal protein S18-alanine N-acetyltransferase [Clostridia bacterium]